MGGKSVQLCDHALIPLDSKSMHDSVVSYVSETSNSDFHHLGQVLPDLFSNKVTVVLPPMQNDGKDVITWNSSVNGCFSIKSVYHAISTHMQRRTLRGRKLWTGKVCYVSLTFYG